MDENQVGNAEGHQGHHLRELSEKAGEILNVRLEVARSQSRLADFADSAGRLMAHPVFFTTFAGAHVGWVIGNLPFVPWTPWDPYPFMLLATIASAEAPIIALLVLMHQRRQERINELREELSLQIDLHIERKSSMMLRMFDDLYRKLGYEAEQVGLDRMKEDLDPEHLMEEMRRELRKAEGEDQATAP